MGQFGHIAFQRLSRTLKDCHFVLVDAAEGNLSKYEGPAVSLIISDGARFLEEHLIKDRKPDWIIPALPVHLAAEWLLLNLGSKGLKRIELPPTLDRLVPHPIHGTDGNLYVSHADFRCPEDCDEPGDICSITGDGRKSDMFKLLGNLVLDPFMSLNIRSHQLGPGIGGYRPGQLLALKGRVEQARGPILLSTACRCHGVITGLER